jgi:predicted nucleic acid-binding protein
LIYVLDTNAVSDFLKKQPTVTNSIIKAQRQQERIIITPPVHYEIMRGLVRHRATTQLTRLNTQILPLFEWGEITDADWVQAAEL